MASKSRFDVETTIKLLETTKQFAGGLKTVDTDDALGSFFLRDAENISLSEYGFIEKRYGLIDTGEFDESPIIQALSHPHQNYKIQGYFEYLRKDGFIDQIVFVNGRLFLSRPNDGISQNPETSDGRFRQVRELSKKPEKLYISDSLFNNYVERFVLNAEIFPNQTTSQTRTNFDDLFLGVEEIEGVRHDDILYLFTGVYPLTYDGDGKFYLLEEFIPTFTELKIFSHNIHNADNAKYYSEITESQIIQDSKFLPSSDENIAFEFLDEVAYPRLPFTRKEGTIFNIEIAYTLHQSLLPSVPFISFMEGPAVRPAPQGGIFAEIIPQVFYRPSGIGASELEWRQIPQDDLKFTRRTNFNEISFTVNTFRTYSVENPPVFQDFEGGVDYFRFDWEFQSNRAINQPISSEDPYKVEIQNMPIGTYDIRVDLVYQTAGYQAVGTNDLKFVRTVQKTIPRVYSDITFTEEQLTDYLEIDPVGLWSCNRVLNHYGKLLAYGSRVNPQRVYVGHPTYTEFFPDFFTIDFETDDEQEIQKITPFMNILVVQSESFTWGLKGIDALIGSESPYQQFSVSPIYGTIAPKSVRPVRNQLFFLSRDGLVSLTSLYAIDDQYNIRHIDQNIENIVPQDRDAVAIQFDNQYWIHFPNTPNNMTLRYYIDTKSWVKDTYFEWNGLDANNQPNPSDITFYGLSRYIRENGELFFITNLMQLTPGANLTFKKLKVEESMPTDLLEAPRTLFETAYMNQGMPFHPKKYMENRFDFTLQNEFNLGRGGEIHRVFGVNSQLVGEQQVINVTNIPKLSPNHTYRVEVAELNPTGYEDESDLPFTLTSVALRKDGQVIGEKIATPRLTASPVLFQDRSFENVIEFRLINNDEQMVDLYYGVNLDINIRNNFSQYPNKILGVGSRNITETIQVVVPGAAQGSSNLLYVIAKARDKEQSPTFVSDAFILSGVSAAPIIEPVTSPFVTQTSIRIFWADANLNPQTQLSASTDFRYFVRNQTTSVVGPVIVGSPGSFVTTPGRYSLLLENLVAGNIYRINVAARFNGVWSSYSSVDVATVPGLVEPIITSIVGTRTVDVNWTDANIPPTNETLQLLQFAPTTVTLTETTPTPLQLAADIITTRVILDEDNTVYNFRMRAVNENTGEQSVFANPFQYAFVRAPLNPQVFARLQTNIEITFQNLPTIVLYELGIKASSLEDIESNWDNFSVSYLDAANANFRRNFPGLIPNLLYDFRYRVLFNINAQEVYSPYATNTISTLAPFDVAATPTVSTVSNTYNSITIRVRNNEPGQVAVYAKRFPTIGTAPTPPIADLDEATDLVGIITTQNGTLDIPFTNLPTPPLREYFFAVQVRDVNQIKLLSNMLVYSEFTTDFPEIGVPANWRTIVNTVSGTFPNTIRDWVVGWDAPTTANGGAFLSGYRVQQFRWFSDLGRPTVTETSPSTSDLGTNVQTRSGSIFRNANYAIYDEVRIRSINQFGKLSPFTGFIVFSL
jgi:hypothetical protein